jgi:hypothetical protein
MARALGLAEVAEASRRRRADAAVGECNATVERGGEFMIGWRCRRLKAGMMGRDA